MNKHTNDALFDHLIEVALDGNIDKLLVALVRTKRALQVEAAYDQPDLPPITPISDRKTTSTDVQCPLCKAKPGKPCVKISGRGLPGVEMGEPLAGGSYHNARIQRAKEASS